MIKYIPGEPEIENYKLTYKNDKIVPFDSNEIISECVYWLKKTVD